MSRLVVAARLVVLPAAAAAVVVAFARQRPAGPVAGQAGYVCPMHAQVVASEPGTCAICGMALERARTERDARPRPYDVRSAQARVVSQEVRAPAYVEAEGVVVGLLYKDDLQTLAPDEQATFVSTAAPGAGVRVRRAADAPAAWDESTARARFRVVDGAPHPSVGTAGWLISEAKPRHVLVIPEAAIRHAASGPYVLVAAADGSFARRPVETGKVLYGLGAVVSGLRNGERVAVENAFFVDAQARLRADAEDGLRADAEDRPHARSNPDPGAPP